MSDGLLQFNEIPKVWDISDYIFHFFLIKLISREEDLTIN